MLKKVLVYLMMVSVLLMSPAITAFAMEGDGDLCSSEVDTEEHVYTAAIGDLSCRVPSLKSMEEMLLSDPDASDVILGRHSLTYTLFGNTSVSIVESRSNDGCVVWRVTENGNTDTIVFSSHNTVEVNGSTVTIEERIVSLPEEKIVSDTRTTWVITGNIITSDFHSETEIALYQASTLLILITFAVKPLVSLPIGLASQAISYSILNDPHMKDLYYTKALFYDQAAPTYHFMQRVTEYKNPNFTGYIYSCDNEMLSY